MENKVLSINRGEFKKKLLNACIEEFEVDGIKVFGLSTKSPVYHAMEGKKKGESFAYKEYKYKIKEVFSSPPSMISGLRRSSFIASMGILSWQEFLGSY